jgi:uncharacterized protein YqeY
MLLKDRIREDMKAAMRGGDKRRLGVIRLIMAAVKQREVDDRIELDDGQVTVVLDKMVKQRRESQSQYEQAQRADLAEQEAYEITVLQEYLPAPLSDTEIAQLIEAAISETGASSMKDMGKIMGVLRPRLAGRADMGAVSGQIKARLGS